MKELVGSARNLFYVRNADGTFTPSIELILVTSEPVYDARIEGDEVHLSPRRETQTLRIGCSPGSLRLLLKTAVDVLEEIEGPSQPASKASEPESEEGSYA